MSIGTLPPVTDVTSPGYPGRKPATGEFSTGRFVRWIGALAVLWFVLSALADSGNAEIARAVAGLIVFGALLALGPGAIANAQKLGG